MELEPRQFHAPARSSSDCFLARQVRPSYCKRDQVSLQKVKMISQQSLMNFECRTAVLSRFIDPHYLLSRESALCPSPVYSWKKAIIGFQTRPNTHEGWVGWASWRANRDRHVFFGDNVKADFDLGAYNWKQNFPCLHLMHDCTFRSINSRSVVDLSNWGTWNKVLDWKIM